MYEPDTHTHSSTPDLEETLRVGLEMALNVTGQECAVLYLPNKVDGGFKLFRSCGIIPEVAQASLFYAAGSSVACTLNEGKSLYGRFPDAVQPPNDNISGVLLPLVHEGHTLACLALGSRESAGIALPGQSTIDLLVAYLGQAIAGKMVEKELRESEAKFRTLAEEITDSVSLNIEGKIAWVNKASQVLTGYSEAEMIGRRMDFLFAAEEHAQMGQRLQERLAGRDAISTYESVLIRKDGSRMIAEITTQGIPIQGQRAILIVCRDVTRRRQAEESLRLTQFALDSAPDSVFWLGPGGRILYANESACKSLGRTRDELLLLCMHEIDSGIALDHCDSRWQELKKLSHPVRETELLTRDGRKLPREVSVYSVTYHGQDYVCVFARDISERKRSEAERQRWQEKMLQTQKLESLGVMAGGIAHDFNNLLMGILGHASLLLMEPQESQAKRNLQQIESAAQRATELVNQLLEYSGRGTFTVQPVNLSHLVEEMGRLLAFSISEKAKLQYALIESLPAIQAEPTQVRQIIMNLIINASEALEDREGTITVSTGMMRVDPTILADVYLNDQLHPGNYVYAEVADTGCGMDASTQAKIFDPFFTTKFTGRGLGLAAVLGIVHAHKGGIRVISSPGTGTTIRVLFPCTSAVIPEEAEPEKGLLDWHQQGKVLVVDDEESVRVVVSMILEEAGLEVVTAADGEEAISLFAAAPADYVAVILDLTMPHIDGIETFHELQRLRADIPVLLSSGYNEKEIDNLKSLRGLAGFIQKPYNARTLLKKIRDIIK